MSLIQVQNLTFSYPGSFVNVFENMSFQLDTDWKLGLVGRNGRGKTTLLRLLQGEYEYSGSIRAGVPFHYFPYPVADTSRLTMEVLEEVCPTAEDWELIRESSLLEVEEDALWRPFATLSPGEQTKALLAALFCGGDRFLLIDEPTNHLDSRGRALLADYLRRKKGFLLVSHDRRFLDGCVDHILALNRTGVEVQSGNFSSWWENKERRDAFEQTENEKLRGEIKRLEQSAEQRKQKADAVERAKTSISSQGIVKHGLRPYLGEKSRKGQQQRKNMDRRAERAVAEKSALLKDLEKAETLKLRPLTARGRLLDLREVRPFYGEKQVCGPLTFQLEPGDRLAIHGGNGSGKSTLLKLLCGESGMTSTGALTRLPGLTVSYVPQDTSRLRGDLQSCARAWGVEETLLLTILRKLNFPREQFETDMADWSQGQKKKVLLARSLCESAHLYVWDEPLNYIDVWSRMQMEALLLQFQPTMVFVEHDRAFRDAVATQTVQL